MYCSGCGQALAPGQGFCPQCGRPVGLAVPPIPGLQYQLDTYAGKIKALSILWAVYAALALVTGIAGMAFANAFLSGRFAWMHGPWNHSPLPPEWVIPAALHFAWVTIVIRVALSAVAAWGLFEHAPWGRVVAIVAAILSMLKFPFGTALGIWTLVVLLGYRNSSLYDQLP
jgi:hypothetical protein